MGESAGPVGPAPLDRLLSVVTLTPAQASLLAVQLLGVAQARAAINGVGRADIRLGEVRLMPSGEVDVGRPKAGEGIRVAELLEQLLRNARRLPAHPRSEQLVLLRRLEEAAADPQVEPGTRARELEGALADALGAGVRQRLSGQLAALVAAFSHVAPSVPAASVPVTGDAFAAPGPPRVMTVTTGVARAAPATPHRAAPRPSAPSRPPRRGLALRRRRARNRRMALVLLVLTAVLVGSGYVLLRSPGGGIAGALGRDSHPAAPGTTDPTDSSNPGPKQPRPGPAQDVQTLAGRHAGPITAVELQKTGSCTPGSLCPVTVTVRLRPSSSAQSLVWKVGAARLCRRGITWSPPVSMTAQPGWTTAYASSSVAVPQGRSLALVAVATTPARAQSRPVPVTGSALRC